MWRYWWYGKDCVDDYKSISITKFKKWGYLNDGYYSGTLTRSYNGGSSSSMWASVAFDNSAMYFNFTGTDNRTQEKKSYNHAIKLVSTPCTYGWSRYWFVCPKCSQKKGVLYLKDFHFACRKCCDLCYELQKISKSFRVFYKVTPRYAEAQKLLSTIKYPYRNGNPTRKYKRYLRLMLADMSSEEKEMYADEYLWGLEKKFWKFGL